MALHKGRVVLLVMDSVGVGATPDASNYGDEAANTLAHVASFVGGATLPTLQSLGLGNITSVDGMPPVSSPEGAYGKCRELSAGKDTATGHWEIAGLKIDAPFPVFPDGFPPEIIDPFVAQTGRCLLYTSDAADE